MSQNHLSANAETAQQRFERLLGQSSLEGLGTILSHVAPDRAKLHAGVLEASTFEELLARLGYKLTLTKQIHVQDSYSRLGQPGGIKVVLPYHDIPTQSSFPTLVNSDATVTVTPRGAAFFTELLRELKNRLSAQS